LLVYNRADEVNKCIRKILDMEWGGFLSIKTTQLPGILHTCSFYWISLRIYSFPMYF